MNPQNKVRTARTTKAAPRPRHKWSCTAITAIKGKSPGKKFLEKIKKVVKSQKYKKSRKVLGLWRSWRCTTIYGAALARPWWFKKSVHSLSF